MSITIKLKRGTQTVIDSYTGSAGELVYDTTNNSLRVHDGSKIGGHQICNITTLDNRYLALNGTAVKAISDSDGNNIASTYAKKSECSQHSVGEEWHSFTGHIPPGGIPYCGQEVTRETYADLWNWANQQGLVKTEQQWQSLNTSQNGNVAFYSDGNGSTTFRMPKLVGYIKGTDSTNSAGSYIKEGLPDIQGQIGVPVHDYHSNTASGAFRGTNFQAYIGYRSGSLGEVTTQNTYGYYFNASLSNSIYGNSGHVTPETSIIIFGVYAFGSITTTGSTTTDAIATGLARIESSYLPLSGGRMTGNIVCDDIKGLMWYMPNGTRYHLRPYGPTNVWQLTRLVGSTEYGVFTSFADGDVQIECNNGTNTCVLHG